MGHRKTQRRDNRGLKIVAILVSALLVVGIPTWFLFPPRDESAASDAVIVLAGASDGRHQLAARLIEEGFSQNFVVSNPDGEIEKVGYSFCQGNSQPKNAEEVFCMQPKPGTTTGEALTMEKLAEEEGWASVTVVTNRPHARRVRTNFEQCTDLDTTVVSVDDLDIARVPIHIAREIAGYIKFWINSPC